MTKIFMLPVSLLGIRVMKQKDIANVDVSVGDGLDVSLKDSIGVAKCRTKR